MKTARASGTVSRILLSLVAVLIHALPVRAAEPDAAAAAVEPVQSPANAPRAASVATAAPTERVVDRLRLDTTAITAASTMLRAYFRPEKPSWGASLYIPQVAVWMPAISPTAAASSGIMLVGLRCLVGFRCAWRALCGR